MNSGPLDSENIYQLDECDYSSIQSQNPTKENSNGKDLINALLPDEVLEIVLRQLLYCQALTGVKSSEKSSAAQSHPTVTFLRVCRRWYILGIPILWTHLVVALEPWPDGQSVW